MGRQVAPERRESDRWVTPRVVVALILAGTVVVLAVLAAVVYLTARGLDPEPVVQLTGTLVAAATSSGTFVLGLVKRRTEAKTERNVGVLGAGVVAALEELDAARGRHAASSWSENEEAPGPGGSDLDQDAGSTAGPRGPSYEAGRYSDTPAEDLRDTAWFQQ